MRESPTIVHVLRTALLRGACAATILAVPSALWLAWFERYDRRFGALSGFVGGALVGLVAGASAVPELLAAGSEPTRRRDAIVVASTVVTAVLAIAAALVQLVFTLTLFDHGSVEAALRKASQLLGELLDTGWPFHTLLALVPCTLPLAANALGRLRGRSLRREVGVGCAASALALVPAHVLAMIQDVESGAFFFVTLELVVAAGLASLVLALAARSADWLDASIERHLSGELA